VTANQDWSPKTREDWVDLFAEGHLKAQAVRDEAEAKAAAAKQEADAKAAEEAAKNAKPSFRDRLLGV
jgi:membrane protein involved in colicin uptake